ncbi:MAG: sugar transferase [Clostridia bacterium]|nr:sugar transferase [Clostridia bacterium]
MRKWEALPEQFKNDSVRQYYDVLCHKTGSLILKRIFDVVTALLITVIALPFMLLIAVWIKCDSRGSVFFLQRRVTTYGRVFRIVKFRTMVSDAEKLGTQVTVSNDSRVTRAGKFLRKCRLDELPQLFNVLKGDMSFVGTRPEVEKYVARYTDEMKATLLMPAGITSLASIRFKDEEKLLSGADNTDEVYVNEVLPLKMTYNLEYIRQFNFFYDVKLMFMTFFAVL